jgi:hypothetical protein
MPFYSNVRFNIAGTRQWQAAVLKISAADLRLAKLLMSRRLTDRSSYCRQPTLRTRGSQFILNGEEVGWRRMTKPVDQPIGNGFSRREESRLPIGNGFSAKGASR